MIFRSFLLLCLLAWPASAQMLLLGAGSHSSGCTIADITISGNAFIGGAPDATVVGAISVPAGGCTFGGTLAIGGTDAASFKLSSTTLPSNLETNGVVAAGSYSITLTATDGAAGNSPFTPAAFAITGNSFLGDLLASTTHKGFWGVRAYTSAEALAGTAKLVNVIRASDSHTCDVLVSSSTGGLGLTANCGTGGDDGQTLASFLTATTGKVVTIYNHVGGGCDMTVTAAARPAMSLSPVGIHTSGTQHMACALAAIAAPVTFLGAIYPLGAGDTSDGHFFSHVQGGSGTWFGYHMGWLSSGTNSHKIQAYAVVNNSFSSISFTSTTLNTSTWGAVGAVFTSTTLRNAYLTAGAGNNDVTSEAPTTEDSVSLGAPNMSTIANVYNGIIGEIDYEQGASTSTEIKAACVSEKNWGWGAATCPP